MTTPTEPVPYTPTITLNTEDHPIVAYLTQDEDGTWNWAFRASRPMMATPTALRLALTLLAQHCDLYVQTHQQNAA